MIIIMMMKKGRNPASNDDGSLSALPVDVECSLGVRNSGCAWVGGSELCWHLFFHANTRQDLFVVVDRVDVFPPFFSGIIGGVRGKGVRR